MRKYYFLIILVTLFACQKDELETNPLDEDEVENIPIDNNFIDLHDTIISLQWAPNGIVDYNLDIDKDSINDINLTVYSYYSSFAGSNKYIKATPLNGFELAFKNYKTTAWRWNPVSDTLFIFDNVKVPIVYHLGDTLSTDDMYSQESQMISYSEWPTGPSIGYYSGFSYGIKESDYFYIGLYKLYNMKSRFAWLKVKTVYNDIIINSCNYIDEEMFVIKKNI